MRTIVWIPVALVALGVVSCNEKKNEAAKPADSTITPTASSAAVAKPKIPKDTKRLKFPGTEDGAKALLESFLQPGADHVAMTKSLRPAYADYDAIFVEKVVTPVRDTYEELWNRNNYLIKNEEGQTKLLMWKATTEELNERTGDSDKFPGGYKKIADKLKPGLTFYRFKFVKPGDKHGRAFDGLVFVNGHWVIVSKPYRAI